MFVLDFYYKKQCLECFIRNLASTLQVLKHNNKRRIIIKITSPEMKSGLAITKIITPPISTPVPGSFPGEGHTL